MREKLISLFKQSFVYTIGSLASPLMGIFMVPIYTRVFAPEDYGIIDLIQITIIFASVALVMGLDNATSRFYLDKENEKEKKAIAATALFVRAAVLFSASGLLVLFSDEISLLLFKSGRQSEYLILAFLAIPFDQCFTHCINMLIFNYRSVSYAMFSAGKLLAKISLTILLVVFLKWGINGVFMAALISSVFFLMVAIIFTGKYFCFSFSIKSLKKMLTYGLPLVPYGFTVYIIQNSSRYFLAHYCTLDEVGIFGVGAKIASVISFIFLGVGIALTPFLYSGYRKKETKDVYLRIVNYSVAISAVTVLGLSLFIKEILLIFTTPQYLGAYIVTPFLAAYVAIFYIGLQMSQGIHIAKKTIYFTAISIITAIVNIGLNFLLVPLYGMVGAAVATLLGSIIWCILLIFISQKYYHMMYKYYAYFKLSLLSIVIIFIVFCFFDDVNITNIMIKIGFICMALTSLYLFGFIGKSEFDYAKLLLKNINLKRKTPSS